MKKWTDLTLNSTNFDFNVMINSVTLLLYAYGIVRFEEQLVLMTLEVILSFYEFVFAIKLFLGNKVNQLQLVRLLSKNK